MSSAERVAEAALEHRRAAKNLQAMYAGKKKDPQVGGVVIEDPWGYHAFDVLKEKAQELDEALDEYETGKGER